MALSLTKRFLNFKENLFIEITDVPDVLKQPHFAGLDGLRGISILVVLACHLAVHTPYIDYFSGDIGVETFFVISGFLITSLLLKEKVKRRKVSFRNFYIRRFLRIVPVAYLFLLALMLLNNYLKLNTSGFDFLTAFLYIKNVPFHKYPDWYTGHFWTLSVEEQYITVDSEGEENILHVSARAAAGYLRGFADPVYLGKLPSFRLPGLTDATYRSFTVDGDSMYPTLKSGQMVIGRWVERLDYIREDRVHILVTKSDGIVIKRLLNRVERYNKIIAKSDATNDRGLYKNIEIAPEDILEIWYAVFHGGFDFQSPADMWKRVNNHEADITMLQNTVSQLTEAIKSAGLIKEKQ